MPATAVHGKGGDEVRDAWEQREEGKDRHQGLRGTRHHKSLCIAKANDSIVS
jgi:hypothetical protein